MEKHLENFLIRNWNQTELSQDFLIYEEEGEPVDQQYATDAGPVDVLAVSRDRKRLLVVELKRGSATDVVVGQTLCYMGYVKEQIAEPTRRWRVRLSRWRMILNCAGRCWRSRTSDFTAIRST